MNQRTLAIAAVLAVLGAAVAGAALLGKGPPRFTLTASATAADKVTLYQNGLAFVELTREFNATAGESLLVFSVPTTTIMDSLTLAGEGVRVKEVRSSLAAAPVVNPGDEVVLHAGDTRTYRGTVLAFDAQILLQTKEGTALVDASKVTAVEILGRTVKASGVGAAEVLVLVSAEEGPRRVRLTYLAQGPGWTPSYALDPQSGKLTFFATLSGLDNWENVRLDLVAGAPNLVATPQPHFSPSLYKVTGLADRSFADASYAPGFGAGGALGELTRYALDRPVNFTRGETVRLPVRDGKVEVLDHFFSAEASAPWSGVAGTRQALDVLERYEVRNTLGEVLPPGVVRFYRDGTWIGDDSLPALAKGERANLTAARSEQVKARLVLEKATSAGKTDTYTYAIKVENYKADKVDVRASLRYAEYRTTLLSTDPAPFEHEGTKLEWRGSVAAGANGTYRATWQTTRD